MKKLSKEKQTHLALVGIVTAAVLGGLWFFLIDAQNTKLKQISGKIKSTQADIDKMVKKSLEEPRVETELTAASNRLAAIEVTLPTGDLLQWFNTTLHGFNTPNYKVAMPQMTPPSTGEMQMIPGFPYTQASVQVQGSAYYYDLGKFIADFENHFPYMRLQNLELIPSGGGEDREKLTYHMDIITLVKP